MLNCTADYRLLDSPSLEDGNPGVNPPCWDLATIPLLTVSRRSIVRYNLRPRIGDLMLARTVTTLGLALLGALALAGCGRNERELAEARTQYVAAADGFVVRQVPAGPARPDQLDRSDQVVQLDQDIELALLVRREAAGKDGGGGELQPLRGVTLDVDQVGAAGASKRHWRVWVYTSGLEPGGEVRTVQRLEDVQYAPGDSFRVEVRKSVPEAERGEYRELGRKIGRTSGRPNS